MGFSEVYPRTAHKNALDKFLKADSNALIVLTTNMSKETLQKVMRLTTSRQVWTELHKLFDGMAEDKVYDLCLQFFGFKKHPGDDVATHRSKLKNLWNDLKLEMSRDARNNPELFDLFLICKIHCQKNIFRERLNCAQYNWTRCNCTPCY
ncbi:zinc knuckle protein [Lasius niger]|uniref:Zinc knuckle protein n=1 Tax=Lasius niger TaxID=67767 RepID=A0A0J7JUA2_LASNI|nr:zinc knuckle protein [Lasius niger]